MDKNKAKIFLLDLNTQLLEIKHRNSDQCDKAGFGFSDRFSVDQELKIISDLQSLLENDNDFSDLIEDYRTLFKLHPNLKSEYKRLKQIPKLQKAIIDESTRIKNKIDSICFSCRQLSDISNSISFKPSTTR